MNEKGCKYTRPVKVMPSLCNADSKLTIPYALDMYQNTAGLHSDLFDIGTPGMDRRNLFWIITKTRIHINDLPVAMEDIEMNTWIKEAERVSCERYFSITRDGETLVYGKSIWAVLHRDTQKLARMEEFYPQIEFNEPSPDDRPFVRLSKKLDDAEDIGEYTIRSVDIDHGGHMNNVNYVRAMLGCFSTEEIEAMNISEIEMNFLLQSYEGETLTFRRKLTDKGMEVGAVNAEGKVAFIALIS